MAQQTINIWTSPNDNTGDNIRNAFDKTNDNFDELYTADGQNVKLTWDQTIGGDKTFTWITITQDNLISQNWFFAQWAGSGTAWSNACAIKSQNTSSGAIWSMRCDNNNDLIFEYYNWATWTKVKTLTSAGSWT